MEARASNQRVGWAIDAAVSAKVGIWRAALITVVGFTALLILLVLIDTLSKTSGQFSFSLDDPYIHFAMAEGILAGGYGLNPGEAAAASSSIAFPVIVAGVISVGAGPLGVLFLNIAATLASAGLAVAVWKEAGFPVRAGSWRRLALVAGVLVLGGNLVGLAFMGMEHSLHVALTLAALLGAVRFATHDRVERWWIACLIAEPLIRYEGLAVALAGAAMLFWRKRWALSGAVIAGAAASPIAFGFYLSSLGLSFLPSSVLAKGGHVSEATDLLEALLAFAGNFFGNAGDHAGLLLSAFAIALLWVAARRSASVSKVGEGGRGRLVALFAGIIVLGHLVCGKFGWGQRYEAYAFFTALVAMPIVFRTRAENFLVGRDGAGVAFVALLAVLAVEPSVTATFESGEGSRNISLQQRQMRRLAVDHIRGPVAVNDLGWVAYRNPNYVLDLWGLGSEEARRLRGSDPAWMDQLATRKGVKLVMIYEEAFPSLPSEWVRLGHLTFRGPLVSALKRDVTFYATRPEYAPEVIAAIAAWSIDLPPRASFMF